MKGPIGALGRLLRLGRRRRGMKTFTTVFPGGPLRVTGGDQVDVTWPDARVLIDLPTSIPIPDGPYNMMQFSVSEPGEDPEICVKLTFVSAAIEDHSGEGHSYEDWIDPEFGPV